MFEMLSWKRILSDTHVCVYIYTRRGSAFAKEPVVYVLLQYNTVSRVDASRGAVGLRTRSPRNKRTKE